MRELKRGGELLEVATRCGFGEAAAAEEFGEELAAGGEFHDDVDLGFGSHDFVDLEDVGMVTETAHRVDLSDYSRLHVGVDGLLLVNDFNGDELVRFDGASQMDFGEASAAETATEFVFPQEDFRRR